MAKSKAQENAMMLDPNRQKIAKNMTVMPGGPENNNPMNVTDIDNSVIQGTSIYGDYKQQYPQVGTAALNPMAIPNSKVPGFMAPGTRLNQGYGRYPQPDINGNSPVADMMEGSRLAMRADPKLPKSPMGLAGMPAIPGGMPGNMQGTSGPPLMPGNPGMVPGSTPQKIGKKKKGGKA